MRRIRILLVVNRVDFGTGVDNFYLYRYRTGISSMLIFYSRYRPDYQFYQNLGIPMLISLVRVNNGPIEMDV